MIACHPSKRRAGVGGGGQSEKLGEIHLEMKGRQWCNAYAVKVSWTIGHAEIGQCTSHRGLHSLPWCGVAIFWGLGISDGLRSVTRLHSP